MTVVSDTTPLHYLILIGEVDLLRDVFGTVVLPEAVRRELSHPHAPEAVRRWAGSLPAWVEVQAAPSGAVSGDLLRLDAGEREAILLANALRADLVLIDERIGRAIARQKGLRVTGTLGVLLRASEQGGVDLAQAVERLRQTNARFSPILLRDVLGKARS